MDDEQFFKNLNKITLYLINSSQLNVSIQAAKEMKNLNAEQKRKIIISFVQLKDQITYNKYNNTLKILNILNINEPILNFICNVYAYRHSYEQIKPYIYQVKSFNFKQYECQSILEELLQLALYNQDQYAVDQILNKLKD